MKAERRHQLQNNTLAQQLETFPEWLKRNASRIMLFITVMLLVAFIVRYRMNAAQLRQAQLADALVKVRQGPMAMRQFDGEALMRYPGPAMAQARNETANTVNEAIQTILSEAEGDSGAPLRAEALVGKGNLNWAMANLSEIPGAATQPLLQLQRSSTDYLKAAEEAYRDVATSYAQAPMAWTSAQMGLAAIAENRHEWAAAKEAYGAIAANNSVPPVFRSIAVQHLQLILPQIEQPVFIGTYPATAPTTAPTTNPAMIPAMIPATTPATVTPAVSPAATTAPASQPSR